MSNRPPAGVTRAGAPAVNARQAERGTPAARPIPSQTSPSGPSTPVTSTVRDELVRAVMPELQVLMQHMVETAVGRAVAPLLDKQRELERALEELRNAQARPQPTPVTLTKQTVEPAAPTRTAQAQASLPVTTSAPSMSHAAVEVGPSPMPTAARPLVRPTAIPVVAVPYGADVLDDIPAELNGSRRKKIILSVLAVTVVVSLAAAGVLSILSNQGMYF